MLIRGKQGLFNRDIRIFQASNFNRRPHHRTLRHAIVMKEFNWRVIMSDNLRFDRSYQIAIASISSDLIRSRSITVIERSILARYYHRDLQLSIDRRFYHRRIIIIIRIEAP